MRVTLVCLLDHFSDNCLIMFDWFCLINCNAICFLLHPYTRTASICIWILRKVLLKDFDWETVDWAFARSHGCHHRRRAIHRCCFGPCWRILGLHLNKDFWRINQWNESTLGHGLMGRLVALRSERSSSHQSRWRLGISGSQWSRGVPSTKVFVIQQKLRTHHLLHIVSTPDFPNMDAQC